MDRGGESKGSECIMKKATGKTRLFLSFSFWGQQAV